MSLELEKVTLRRGGQTLLDAVSFQAIPGQVTAICGPNGAGKSTALGVLSGAVRPDQGAARLNNKSIYHMKPAQLARQRAVLPQASSLSFPFQVHEIVAMGRAPHQGLTSPAQDAIAIKAAMDAARIAHMAERNYLSLSGGERQRVQLARVLAQLWFESEDGAARWLLLDEPTSALDLKHQLSLMKLLRNLAEQGWGIVAVLHDLALVQRHADQVVLFSRARILHAGPPEEALSPAHVRTAFELEDEDYPLFAV